MRFSVSTGTFSASIGSFQRLRAEVILLLQRLALKYNTTHRGVWQALFATFLNFFRGLYTMPCFARQTTDDFDMQAGRSLIYTLYRDAIRAFVSAGRSIDDTRYYASESEGALSRVPLQNFVLKILREFWRILQNTKCSGFLLDLSLNSDKIESHSVWISKRADGYLLL